LVQLPLPKHINKQHVIETISPHKDVDGLHPMNVGNLSSGYQGSIPCTPLGCYYLLKKGVIFINVLLRLKFRVIILCFAEGAPTFPSPNPGLAPIAG